MKKYLPKIPYLLCAVFSLLILLQISLIMRDSYSEKGELTFFNEYPEKADSIIQTELPNTLAKSNLININSASISELDTLIGIGEVTAKKIVDNRPYISFEDLTSKAGISNTTVLKLKDLITL